MTKLNFREFRRFALWPRDPQHGRWTAFRARLVAVYAVLAIFNAAAWAWALVVFGRNPVLFGVCLAVYGLGLRHAVDADHIAAIDNVTRKLMQEKQRPVAVGFFFALGHSAVVIVVTAAVIGASTLFNGFQSFKDIGATLGTSVSAAFLILIAAMNITIFIRLYSAYRHLRTGKGAGEFNLDRLLSSQGVISQLFRPLFKVISKSWHMLPLGFLFGLSFDTATEVAMFGLSATQLSHGVLMRAVMVFPALFAAGMTLVDTTDGVMMLGAYEWAFVNPMRKIYYNMTITLTSIFVALVIAGIEVLGLCSDSFRLQGGIWKPVVWLNQHFNEIGFVIIGVFLAAWAASYLIYRARNQAKFDEPRTGGASSG